MFTEPFGITGIQWLHDQHLAMPAVLIVSVWKNIGYYMVIFLAGLQAIPSSYYEAAKLDGAGSWAIFRHVTLPLLKPFILFVTVVSIIKASQAFRSEEHTSELQSLMRISYAVFCLNTKNSILTKRIRTIITTK